MVPAPNPGSCLPPAEPSLSSPQAHGGLLLTQLQLGAAWLLAQGLGWEGEGANTVTRFFHMPHWSPDGGSRKQSC